MAVRRRCGFWRREGWRGRWEGMHRWGVAAGGGDAGWIKLNGGTDYDGGSV